MNGVGDEIERLKRAMGVELDRDLAAGLRIDASAVAAWRRRGRVPDKYRLAAERHNDQAAAEGVTLPVGTGLRDAYIFALIRLAALRLGHDIWGRGEYDAMWAGFRLARLHAVLDKAVDHRAAPEQWREKFESFRREIEDADLPMWLETIGSS